MNTLIPQIYLYKIQLDFREMGNPALIVGMYEPVSYIMDLLGYGRNTGWIKS